MSAFPTFLSRPAVRTSLLILLCTFITVAVKDTLATLLSYSLNDDRVSYIVVLPFVVLLLIYLKRKEMFQTPQYSLRLGGHLFLLGLALSYLAATHDKLPGSGAANLAVAVLGVVILYIGTFVFCFGQAVLKCAALPLFLIFFVVPLPTPLIETVVVALQKGSADVAVALFKLLGVPVFRHGFQLSLPGIDIEITEHCSGIRSALSLVLMSLVAGHLLLRSTWEKVCFTLITVPIVIFKNAVRIVTISILGVYVDRTFFYGKLHRYGGLPFSLISLAIMAMMLAMLTMRYRSSAVQKCSAVHPERAPELRTIGPAYRRDKGPQVIADDERTTSKVGKTS